MNKVLAALAIAAATPAAMIAATPAAMAQAETEAEFVIPTPPAGKGQVIFYRTGGLSGAALGCAVFDVGAADKLSSQVRGAISCWYPNPARAASR